MQTETRTTFFNRKLALAGVAAIAFVASLFYVRSRTAAIPYLLPLPNPNGFDDFLLAAEAIQGSPIEVSSSQLDELRSCIEKNQKALRWVRAGLSHESVVPVPTSEKAFEKALYTSTNLINLVFLVERQADFAGLENRKMDAWH